MLSAIMPRVEFEQLKGLSSHTTKIKLVFIVFLSIQYRGYATPSSFIATRIVYSEVVGINVII